MYAMCDTAASIILDYIQEHLFSPSLSWDKREFKRRSYQQWTAHEIIERILDHPFDPPLTTIENFLFEMYFYACFSGEDEERTFIFQTAVETAEEIVLLFV